jgi:hypothetical protein
MKEKRSSVVLLFALFATCALLYGIWHLYQLTVTREQHDQTFTAPPPSGLPNFLSATPGAPPPQP